MKKIILTLAVLVCFLFGVISLESTCEKNEVNPTGTEISTLRIGYVESETFDLYTNLIKNIASDFQKEGVLKPYTLDSKTGKEAWIKMCENNNSNEFKFVKDMYFNLKDMNESEYKKAINNESVDLIIAMGTTAGKYLAENETKNKFMVFGAADPILSGIIKSETEKNNPNAFAHVDRAKYKRQIQVGHKILKFKKVGVVHQDDEAAYAYSGIDSLKEAARELNFEIVIKHVDEAKDENDYDRYYKDLEKAYKELVDERIDVLYITTATIQDEKLYELLSHDIYPNKIPTMAQTSESQVKCGATLGVTLLDSEEQAAFAVAQIKKYKSGEDFEKLDQVNESTPKIYINYDVAEKIGIKIPFSILLITDAIYHLDS